jgi:hypothetical protein
MRPISHPAAPLALACLATLALAASGCGGSSDPGVAHLGTTAAASGATSSAAGSGASGGSLAASGGGGGGGGSGGEVHSEVSIAGPGGAAAQKQLVAFAQCMRSHGLPNFPEPVEGHLTIKDLSPSSPQFQAAQKACAHLMPGGGLPSPAQSAEFQAKALKFSECMRSHGEPNFPDPKVEGGGVRLQIGPSSGIDPRSPQFQAAQKACQGDMPGPKGGPAGAAPVPAGPEG